MVVGGGWRLGNNNCAWPPARPAGASGPISASQGHVSETGTVGCCGNLKAREAAQSRSSSRPPCGWGACPDVNPVCLCAVGPGHGMQAGWGKPTSPWLSDSYMKYRHLSAKGFARVLKPRVELLLPIRSFAAQALATRPPSPHCPPPLSSWPPSAPRSPSRWCFASLAQALTTRAMAQHTQVRTAVGGRLCSGRSTHFALPAERPAPFASDSACTTSAFGRAQARSSAGGCGRTDRPLALRGHHHR